MNSILPFAPQGISRYIVVCCSLLLLNACASFSSSDKQTADEVLKAQKHDLPVTPKENWQVKPNPALYNQQAVNQYWLADFKSDALNQLVQAALSNNLDLKSIEARINRAKAQVLGSQAARLFSTEIDINARRGRSSPISSVNNAYKAGLNTRWEADIWGRLGDKENASQLDLQASKDDLKAAKFLLSANIAKRWFGVIEAQQQSSLAAQSVISYQQTLASIKERYLNGLNSALDLRLARNNLAIAENNLALRQSASDKLIRSLNSLLGRYPSNIINAPSTLPDIGSAIPAGMPAELLSRRIDLIAAERRLLAANFRSQSAQKNHLPKFNLTGSSGLSSLHLRELIHFDNLIWNILADLSAPLFDQKRLASERLSAEADQQSAWIDYARSVQIALEEVEIALASSAFFQAQQTALLSAETEAAKATELADDRYQNGLENIVTLLDTKRRWFSAQGALLKLRLARLNGRVDLYLALGGDMGGSMGGSMDEAAQDGS